MAWRANVPCGGGLPVTFDLMSMTWPPLVGGTVPICAPDWSARLYVSYVFVMFPAPSQNGSAAVRDVSVGNRNVPIATAPPASWQFRQNLSSPAFAGRTP